MLHISYVRWMYTQEHDGPPQGPPDTDEWWLMTRLTGMRELYRRRLPGAACLAALKGHKLTCTADPVANSSKGCGAVVRMAPIGLVSDRPDRIMSEAVAAAALTHGDPGGQLPAAAFALIIHHLAGGSGIRAAVAAALGQLDRLRDHKETSSALELAVRLASGDLPPAEALARLGNGAQAPGALAVAVYCAFMARDFREGVLMAVNRDGDPMGPASLAGSMLGCLYGVSGIPREWLDGLELADVIAEVALDLYTCGGWNVSGMGQVTGYEDSWAMRKYLIH
jgi:ADP-ribosylglycohydrolase